MKKPVVILTVLLALSVVLIAFFYKQYAENEAVLVKRNKLISEQHKTLADLNNELDESKRQLSETTETVEILRIQKDRLTEFEASIEEKERTIQSLLQSRDTQQAEYQELEGNYQKALSDLENKNKLLSEMQDEFEASIEEKERTIQSLLQSRDTQQAEYQELEGNYQKALSDLENKNKLLSEMQDEFAASIEEKERTIQSLLQSRDTQQAEYQELEGNYQKALADLNDANTLLAEMQDEHAAAMNTLIHETNERQKVLQDQLNYGDQELQERQNNIQQIEASMDALEKNFQAISDRYRQAQNDIDTLQSKNSELKKTLADLTLKLTVVEKQNLSDQDKMKNQKIRIKQVEETYENLLAELHNEIAKKEVALQQLADGLNITLIDKILFDFGQTGISAEGQQKLLKVAGILSKIENKKIQIQGHTDNIPIAPAYRYKYPSNWELSAARAATVARFFIEQGNIKGENLEAVGHAYFKPIASNETFEGRSQNRRVEILISP